MDSEFNQPGSEPPEDEVTQNQVPDGHELQRREDELAALDKLLYPLREILTRTINYQSFIIFLVNREGLDREIVARYCIGPYADLFRSVTFRITDNVLGWAMLQKKPLLLEDTRESKLPNVLEQERSVIIIPMVIENEVIGAYYVGSADPCRYYDEEGLQLIFTVASQTTLEIRNALRQE
jgi:GAF domain-containing protein